MLQVIRAIMKDPDDHTVCHLLFANQVSGHSRDVQTQLLLRGATGPGEACLGVRVGGAPNILSTGSFAAAGGGGGAGLFSPKPSGLTLGDGEGRGT